MNDAISQIRDLFQSMTPAARITSALLVGVIAVSLTFLAQGFSGGPDEMLFDGELLRTDDAARIESAIAKSNLSGYRRQGNRFFVPSGQKAAYMAAVANEGALPANFDTLLADSLDMNPFVSSEERAQRFKEIRERKLSMIIRQMDGVEDAKVLSEIREPRGFGKRLVTATVSLKQSSDGALNPARIAMIRTAVTKGLGILDPNDVAIINASDGSYFGVGSGGMADSFDDPYFKTRTQYEELMKSRIEELYRDIPGMRVQVTAELDEALERVTSTVKNDGEGAPIRQTKQTETVSNERTENQGRPGLEAQGPTRSNVDESVAKNTSSEKNITTDSENFIPTVQMKLREAGLVPKSVRAAIAIPSSYLVRVWREKNADKGADAKPSEDDMKNLQGPIVDNIRQGVANMLTIETGGTEVSNVEVTILQSLTPEPLAPPSIASTGLAWAGQHVNTIVMAVVALVCLKMLRTMVKSAPPYRAAGSLRSPELSLAGGVASSAAATPASAESPAAGTAAAGEGRQRLKLKKGPSLRDDLTEIVREDPDAAAAILRSWIGNAA